MQDRLRAREAKKIHVGRRWIEVFDPRADVASPGRLQK
jgi:hypothetical protein